MPWTSDSGLLSRKLEMPAPPTSLRGLARTWLSPAPALACTELGDSFFSKVTVGSLWEHGRVLHQGQPPGTQAFQRGEMCAIDEPGLGSVRVLPQRGAWPGRVETEAEPRWTVVWTQGWRVSRSPLQGAQGRFGKCCPHQGHRGPWDGVRARRGPGPCLAMEAEAKRRGCPARPQESLGVAPRSMASLLSHFLLMPFPGSQNVGVSPHKALKLLPSLHRA